ncbi:MAG: hypothetical protein J4G01_09305 [Dehalococcoidia bacterium]|nr:hypothetical protein [Dehalococcoidia bacterium]
MNYAPLPQRAGDAPKITEGMPQLQIGVDAVDVVNAELFRRVYSLPSVQNQLTVISPVEGSRALWVDPAIDVAHPELLPKERELGHIHPDGSLHMAMDPERGQEAVDAGWALFHPAAGTRPGFQGFMLLYTPRDMEELNVICQLIVDGYNHVVGASVDAAILAG